MQKIVKIVALHAWLLISLYIGLGGYVLLDVEKRKEQGLLLPKEEVQVRKVTKTGKIVKVTYHNEQIAIAASDEAWARKFFLPLVEDLPKSMLYLLTAMAFGAIGGVTKVVKKIAIDNTSVRNTTVYTTPLLGVLTGILVLGIANLLPDLLMVGERAVDPMSLAFFSLLAGLSSESFFGWLLNVNERLFN